MAKNSAKRPVFKPRNYHINVTLRYVPESSNMVVEYLEEDELFFTRTKIGTVSVEDAQDIIHFISKYVESHLR